MSGHIWNTSFLDSSCFCGCGGIHGKTSVLGITYPTLLKLAQGFPPESRFSLSLPHKTELLWSEIASWIRLQTQFPHSQPGKGDTIYQDIKSTYSSVGHSVSLQQIVTAVTFLWCLLFLDSCLIPKQLYEPSERVGVYPPWREYQLFRNTMSSH